MVPKAILKCTLQAHLDAYGLTHQELADAVGVKRQTVDNWVNAVNAPNLFVAYLVASVFNKDVKDIWRLEGM